MPEDKSLMNMRNIKVPKTVPCGTTGKAGDHSNALTLTLMLISAVDWPVVNGLHCQIDPLSLVHTAS